MALRTQVDPYVLIGDSLADLPDPASVAQGYLFHEEATGSCLVLVIDPITGVRSWEAWCEGAVTGATGATGPAGVGAGALALSGDVAGLGAGVPAFFAAQIAGNSSPTPIGYPAPAGATLITNLGVNFTANSLSQPSFVQAYLNGLPVGLPIAVPAASGPVELELAQAIPVAPTDTVDIGIFSLLAATGAAALAATITYGS